jgi:hypothetical protein
MKYLLKSGPNALFFTPSGQTGGGTAQNRVDFARLFELQQVELGP